MTKQFPGLVPPVVDLDSPVHLAQRYLASAYDSVASLIEMTYPAMRAQREGARGRLTHAEQDLFRAAVVFACAGVDAVLKEALRSCVPIQIEACRRHEKSKWTSWYVTSRTGRRWMPVGSRFCLFTIRLETRSGPPTWRA